MTFESMKAVTFTREQAVIHLKALAMYSNRMIRNLESTKRQLEQAKANGNYAEALRLTETVKIRLKYIASTKKEFERYREIVDNSADFIVS